MQYNIRIYTYIYGTQYILARTEKDIVNAQTRCPQSLRRRYSPPAELLSVHVHRIRRAPGRDGLERRLLIRRLV